MFKVVKISAFLLVASLSFANCYSKYTMACVQEVKIDLKNQAAQFEKEMIEQAELSNKEKKELEDKIEQLRQDIIEQIKDLDLKEAAGISLSKEDELKLKYLLKQVIQYK